MIPCRTTVSIVESIAISAGGIAFGRASSLRAGGGTARALRHGFSGGSAQRCSRVLSRAARIEARRSVALGYDVRMTVRGACCGCGWTLRGAPRPGCGIPDGRRRRRGGRSARTGRAPCRGRRREKAQTGETPVKLQASPVVGKSARNEPRKTSERPEVLRPAGSAERNGKGRDLRSLPDGFRVKPEGNAAVCNGCRDERKPSLRSAPARPDAPQASGGVLADVLRSLQTGKHAHFGNNAFNARIRSDCEDEGRRALSDGGNGNPPALQENSAFVAYDRTNRTSGVRPSCGPFRLWCGLR